MHGAQIGDPLKAAAAIALALEAEDTPLRLQLGEDAVAAVRAHAMTMLEDLEHWQAIGPIAIELTSITPRHFHATALPQATATLVH